MNQVSSPSNGATSGALFMLLGAFAFAGTNLLQSVLPTPVEYGGFGMSSTGMAFWQYVIAGLLSLPLIFRLGGIRKLHTRHPFAHEMRAFVSALGVHVYVYGFAVGAPVWQMVTLLAAGPLLIVLGSIVFLGERASAARIAASVIAFIGAVIVSGTGEGGFTWVTLIPIAAAALWATSDVLTKYLTRDESPDSLTVSLLVLVTPNHLLILLAVNVLGWLAPSLLPTGLSTGFPFALPTGEGLWLLLLLGALTGLAQYLLTFAYKLADAAYLQPFGDLKVPLTGLLGWIVLSQVPGDLFWWGAALIVAASSFIYWVESRGRRGTLATA